jgi:hypothetical protein
MAEPYVEIAKVVLPGLIGALGGYFIKYWDVRRLQRKEENDLWVAQRQSYWSPLLRATSELETRFAYLRDIYTPEKLGMPFSPLSLSADFRELYMLSRNDIPNLQEVDPNVPRRNDHAVQHVRARVCHELTFAESSVYITAAYLGHAEHVWRDLYDDRLPMSPPARNDLLGLVSKVRQSLHGKSGAGIFLEQQEYIGQTLLHTSGGVITNLEFRQRLFDLPGWEAFNNLLRFFAEFAPKVNFEVTDTIAALGPLRERLGQLRVSDTPAQYFRNQRQ